MKLTNDIEIALPACDTLILIFYFPSKEDYDAGGSESYFVEIDMKLICTQTTR